MTITYAPDWADEEIKRFLAREGMFIRRGLSASDAERLAEKCLDRDRAPDWRDMHACIECKHLQSGGRCAATKRDALPKEIFHRCHSFGWQVPRKQG